MIDLTKQRIVATGILLLLLSTFVLLLPTVISRTATARPPVSLVATPTSPFSPSANQTAKAAGAAITAKTTLTATATLMSSEAVTGTHVRPTPTPTPALVPLHTYYVAPNGNDNGVGKEAAPFRTIQHALDLTIPGDIIYVREGVYAEALMVSNSGSAERPIRILAYPGERPIIDGQYELPTGKPVACNNRADPPRCFVYTPLVRIKANYIEFAGFEVRHSAGRGIGVAGSETNRIQGVQVRDCAVHDVRNSTIHILYADEIIVERCDIYHTSDYATYDRSASTLNWPAALVASRSTHVLFVDNIVHENWGAGISADVDSTDVVIRDNVIYDNYAAHVYIHRSQKVTVERNFIYNTNQLEFRRNGDPHDCIVFNNEEEFMSSQTVKDVNVLNNVIVGCGMNIAMRGSEGTGLPFENVRITHNTLVNAQANLPSTEPYGLNVMGKATLINVLFAENIVQQDTGIIGNVRPDAGIIYRDNLWSRQPPPHMLGSGSIVANPQLLNPDTQRQPGQVQIEWYQPAKGSPALLHNIGPEDYFDQSVWDKKSLLNQ